MKTEKLRSGAGIGNLIVSWWLRKLRVSFS